MSAFDGYNSSFGSIPFAPVGSPQAWYDASDTSSLTIVSNKVSQWNDKSGSGFHLSQGTAANRPLYDATPRFINGVICLEFTTAEFMTSSCPADSHTSTTFIAGLVDTVSAARTLVGDNSPGGGNEIRLDTSARPTILKSGVATLFTPKLALGPTKTFALVEILASSTIDVGTGGSRDTVSDSTAFTAGRTLKIGKDQSGTVSWDGLIAEFIRYSTTLSDSDIRSNMLYLINKWAI